MVRSMFNGPEKEKMRKAYHKGAGDMTEAEVDLAILDIEAHLYKLISSDDPAAKEWRDSAVKGWVTGAGDALSVGALSPSRNKGLRTKLFEYVLSKPENQ